MSARYLGFTDLRYVIAVAECQSISRAAEACSITQPALSERIKRIETVLGTELFERNKRALSITPIGERLVVKAREILDSAAEIDDIVATAHRTLAGPLRVGVIATLGPYLMPLVLPRLRREYPDLQLVLREGLTDSLLASLQAGALDLVVAAAPLHASGISHRKLFDEDFVLAVPAGHALAQRREIHARDLQGEEMVLLQDGHCLSGQALDICPVKKRSNRKRLHAMSLETLRHMVASGAGYTLMPFLAVGANPPMTGLITYRNLSGSKRYGREIVLAWRNSFKRNADIEHFAALIQASLPGELLETGSIRATRPGN